MTKSTFASTSERLSRVEQTSNVLLVAGMLLVYVTTGLLFWAGIAFTTAGVAGMFGSLIARGEHWHTVVERLMVVGMMLGLVGMLQANFIILYEYGFYVMGLCTLGFIIVLHIPVPEAVE